MATNPPSQPTPRVSTVRVPTQSVVVVRDKASFVPPIGQPFEFTADEIKQIDSMSPGVLSTQGLTDVTEMPVEKDI